MQTARSQCDIAGPPRRSRRRQGYIIIPKPHFSSREGIISRCRFYLLHFPVLAQSDTARPSLYIIAVVASHVRYRWRSIDRDRRTMASRCLIQKKLVRESVFAIVFGSYISYKTFLGRTETRTRDRMGLQSIRSV